jgi:hypothetical protein
MKIVELVRSVPVCSTPQRLRAESFMLIAFREDDHASSQSYNDAYICNHLLSLSIAILASKTFLIYEREFPFIKSFDRNKYSAI